MAVYHILKDGSTPTDITGHIVRIEDAAPLYRYLSTLVRGKSNTNQNTYNSNQEVSA